MTADDVGRALKPKFNSQISLGNVLQLCAMLVTVTIAYANLQAGIAANRVEIDRHTRDLLNLESADARLAAAIQSVDRGAAADRAEIKEILVEVRADLRYMREAIDRQPRL